MLSDFFFAISLPIAALDKKSSEFIEFLLNLKEPSAPKIFDDSVVFTAPSFYKRVGISFAHDGFSEIHWMVKLLVPIDDTATFDPKSKAPPEMLKDSGMLFYAYTPEKPLDVIEYRVIIDGLWSADPLNMNKKLDSETGTQISITNAPYIPAERKKNADSCALQLHYNAPSGETITVAGDFNGWDPFMYQLKEESPGFYVINIPLPTGKWHYVLFNRGRRLLDPNNLDKVYAKNGIMANTIVLK